LGISKRERNTVERGPNRWERSGFGLEGSLQEEESTGASDLEMRLVGRDRHIANLGHVASRHTAPLKQELYDKPRLHQFVK
jgi:hypothetical protein